MLASGQGREALDVDAEQPGKCVGLRLAQLRELRCDVPDRAVTLTHLDASQATNGDRTSGGGKSVARQRVDERLGLRGRCAVDGRELAGIPALEAFGASAGELSDGFSPGSLAQKAQDIDREVVVVVGQRVQARRCGNPLPSRPTTSARSGRAQGRLSLDDGSIGLKGIEVAAHRCRRERQLATERRRADGSARRDRREDAIARPSLRSGRLDIHNISMP